MEPAKIIERLASLAREEESPRVDVTGEVMRQIARSRTQPRISARDLGWMAAASAVAAGLLVFFTAQAWMELFDPVNSLFQPLFLMIP